MGKSPRSWARASAIHRSINGLWEDGALGDNNNMSATVEVNNDGKKQYRLAQITACC